MRITLAIQLGLTSTALWGCKNNVTKEDLEKQITSIEDTFEGSLHDIEKARLRRARDTASAASSSERRYYQKTLKHMFGNAKEPITRKRIEEIHDELNTGYYVGGDYSFSRMVVRVQNLAREMLQHFDELTPDQKTRLGAALMDDLARIKIFIERRNGINAKLDGIREKFGDQLLDFERELIDLLRQDRPINESGYQLFNEVLDSIYIDNLKFPEVTKKEIEDTIAKAGGDAPLQAILDQYETLNKAQRKRVKGWLVALDRFNEKAKSEKAKVDV